MHEPTAPSVQPVDHVAENRNGSGSVNNDRDGYDDYQYLPP